MIAAEAFQLALWVACLALVPVALATRDCRLACVALVAAFCLASVQAGAGL